VGGGGGRGWEIWWRGEGEGSEAGGQLWRVIRGRVKGDGGWKGEGGEKGKGWGGIGGVAEGTGEEERMGGWKRSGGGGGEGVGRERD